MQDTFAILTKEFIVSKKQFCNDDCNQFGSYGNASGEDIIGDESITKLIRKQFR